MRNGIAEDFSIKDLTDFFTDIGEAGVQPRCWAKTSRALTAQLQCGQALAQLLVLLASLQCFSPAPASPPWLRTKTVSSGSYYSGGAGPKSQVDPSIYTVLSSEDGTLELLSLSVQPLALQQLSYPHQLHFQPLLLTTFSDQASCYLSSGVRAE